MKEHIMNDEKDYYTVAQMARQMGVTSMTIYRWIKAGLKAEKRARGRVIGKHITMGDMNEFLKNNPSLK